MATANTVRSQKTLAHALLLATALVWGATFTVVKSALVHISPLLFNLLRMTLATLALAAINHRALRGITRKQLAGGAMTGVFLGVGYQFQTLGLLTSTPTKAAFITGMLVVFVPVFLLVPAFRPAGAVRPGMAAACGAALAFAGLMLITTPAGTTLRGVFGSLSAGDLLCLGGAIAFAAHLLALARFSKGMSAGVLATLQVGFGAITMLLTLPLERPHVLFAPSVLLALGICALLGTVAAFTIQSFAQQILPPTHTVLILALEPVFAWLTSLLFLGEVLEGRAIVGAALILVGILAVELFPSSNISEIPA